MLWTAIVMLTTMAGNTMGGGKDESMGADSLEKINDGVGAGEKIVTFFNYLDDPKNEKVFSALGTMASFLGAYGGLISFALLFVPKSESAELKFMKKQFAEVNQKLDRITAELDNIKHLITYENQRSVYLDSASKILFAHKQLFVFLDELEKAPCNDKKNCKRVRARIASRYVEHFNVKQDIFKIMNGAVKSTSAFGDPILKIVSKTCIQMRCWENRSRCKQHFEVVLQSAAGDFGARENDRQSVQHHPKHGRLAQVTLRSKKKSAGYKKQLLQKY